MPLPNHPQIGLESCGVEVVQYLMSESHATIRQIAFGLLFLTTGLSAQRYTGHDHAVFHRQPQTPAAAKHQSSSTNTATSHPKTTASTSSSAQQGSRAGATQGKLDVDLNHASSPSKTEQALENTPRM